MRPLPYAGIERGGERLVEHRCAGLKVTDGLWIGTHLPLWGSLVLALHVWQSWVRSQVRARPKDTCCEALSVSGFILHQEL